VGLSLNKVRVGGDDHRQGLGARLDAFSALDDLQQVGVALQTLVVVVGSGTAGSQGFLQQRIKGGSWESVTGQFQEGPGQGFTRRRPYRRVAAPQILFLTDGR
jgi:hypothetical protein